jgi:hypothetical protein
MSAFSSLQRVPRAPARDVQGLLRAVKTFPCRLSVYSLNCWKVVTCIKNVQLKICPLLIRTLYKLPYVCQCIYTVCRKSESINPLGTRYSIRWMNGRVGNMCKTETPCMVFVLAAVAMYKRFCCALVWCSHIWSACICICGVP